MNLKTGEKVCKNALLYCSNSFNLKVTFQVIFFGTDICFYGIIVASHFVHRHIFMHLFSANNTSQKPQQMRQLLVFVCSFLFVTISHAQVLVGIKGGLNVATVRYINSDNSKARIGWNAGLTAEIPVGEEIFIRPELLYSSKGFGYNATATSNKGSLSLNYISIPLLFGYRPGKHTELMAGPEFGYLSKAVSKSQGITDDVTSFYRHVDIGADIGAAYNFSKTFGAEVRYNYGFKDLENVPLYDNSNNLIGQGKNGANSVFQIGIYYWMNQ